MADYSRKHQGLTGQDAGRFVHIDGSVTTPITVLASTLGGKLKRVVLNTNGATLRVRSGSEVICNIALDAPEQVFEYGVYFANGLIYEAGGALDATLVFDR
jgi:hypothetical protein